MNLMEALKTSVAEAKQQRAAEKAAPNEKAAPKKSTRRRSA
jgi:hypothetical protein